MRFKSYLLPLTAILCLMGFSAQGADWQSRASFYVQDERYAVEAGQPRTAQPVQPTWLVRANSYRKDLTREARVEFGLNAPIPLFAAQIHQESLWRKSAQSKYANGLTQFTPSTEEWIKTVYPNSLGNGNAFNPQWAIRAMVKYDKWLYKRISATDTCNRWAFTLSAYNGGLGWVNRDKRLAKKAGKNDKLWWGNVEFHSSRATWAFKENRGYPAAIIYKHQAHYANWGGATICL